MSSVQHLPDPLVQASFRQCESCRRVAYAADAVWLDANTILVNYAAVCTHLGPVVVVLAVSQLSQTDIDPELYLPGRRCARSNRLGRPCGNFAVPGSVLCYCHRRA
jgi:hypothetical protein